MVTMTSLPELAVPTRLDALLSALVTHDHVCLVRHTLAPGVLRIVVEERGSSAWYILTCVPARDHCWALVAVDPWLEEPVTPR